MLESLKMKTILIILSILIISCQKENVTPAPTIGKTWTCIDTDLDPNTSPFKLTFVADGTCSYITQSGSMVTGTYTYTSDSIYFGGSSIGVKYGINQNGLTINTKCFNISGNPILTAPCMNDSHFR